MTPEEYNNTIAKMTIAEKIQYAENVAYVYFNLTNTPYLKYIRRPKDIYSIWDCSGETLNNIKFVIEFKVRDYVYNDFTGWIIENKKLRALETLWLNDKSLHIVYICYLNDVVIEFNLSCRFKQHCNSDILSTYVDNMNHSKYNNNYCEDKLVNHLHYNAEEFHDKIIKYVNTEIQ